MFDFIGQRKSCIRMTTESPISNIFKEANYSTISFLKSPLPGPLPCLFQHNLFLILTHILDYNQYFIQTIPIRGLRRILSMQFQVGTKIPLVSSLQIFVIAVSDLILARPSCLTDNPLFHFKRSSRNTYQYPVYHIATSGYFSMTCIWLTICLHRIWNKANISIP